MQTEVEIDREIGCEGFRVPQPQVGTVTLPSDSNSSDIVVQIAHRMLPTCAVQGAQRMRHRSRIRSHLMTFLYRCSDDAVFMFPRTWASSQNCARWMRRGRMPMRHTLTSLKYKQGFKSLVILAPVPAPRAARGGRGAAGCRVPCRVRPAGWRRSSLAGSPCAQ